MYDAVLVPVEPGHSADVAIEVAKVVADAIGCGVETVTFDADPVASLLQLLEVRTGALLCMPTAAHAGVGELLLGSTAFAVVRATRHPVLLVGPDAEVPKRIDTILACVDGSPPSARAVETGGVWARMLGADLHVVRVAPPGEPGDPHDSAVDLQRLAAGVRNGVGVRVQWEVLHGTDVAEAVNAQAAYYDASLLVVTPHGSGASHRVLGSTAMRIVRDARVPVLVAPAT